MCLYVRRHHRQGAGRLTLNPIKHVDPVGSIIVPGLYFWHIISG